MGANFGRDADTIATLVGGICEAFRGVYALDPRWVAKAEAGAGADYGQIADRLGALIARRRDDARAYADLLDRLLA